jgi:hypothetical protein
MCVSLWWERVEALRLLLRTWALIVMEFVCFKLARARAIPEAVKVPVAANRSRLPLIDLVRWMACEGARRSRRIGEETCGWWSLHCGLLRPF